MAFIEVPNVAQFNLLFSAEGQITENVFHLQKAGGWDITSFATACAAIVDWWDTDLQPLTSAYVFFNSIVVVDLTTQNAPGLEYSTGLPLQGGIGAQDMEPTSVAALVKWITQYRGRSYKGRTYFMGIPTNNCTVNTLAGAYREGLEQAYRNLFQDLATAGTPMGVVSRYHNNAPRAEGIFTPITGVSVGPYIGSQRRRLTGRGI